MFRVSPYARDGEARWDERNWLQRQDGFPFKPLEEEEEEEAVDEEGSVR